MKITSLPVLVTAPDVVVSALIERASFSSSVSLPSTLIFVAAASSKIVAVSGLATGASLTAVTVTVSTPAAVVVPSVSV